METLKVKYVGFWSGFSPEKEFITRSLRKNYRIEIADDPEFIICSLFGKRYEYCSYPQVRIMYAGENYIPNFNLVDYAVGVYPLSFGDRYFYLPGCIDGNGHCAELQYKSREYPDTILDEKPFFANFIASHDSEYNLRGNFFKKLCQYKRVESPGTYLNNMDDASIVSLDDGKIEFQKKCKFTLCFESTAHEGFVTEKITDAFYSDTIPIYYGSSTAASIFNPKAFINCSDYSCFDDIISKIIELDQDDEKYMEMLRQPVFLQPDYVDCKMRELESFIQNIVEQGPERAYRRSRVYAPKAEEEFLLSHRYNCEESSIKDLCGIILKRILRKIFRKKS